MKEQRLLQHELDQRSKELLKIGERRLRLSTVSRRTFQRAKSFVNMWNGVRTNGLLESRSRLLADGHTPYTFHFVSSGRKG